MVNIERRTYGKSGVSVTHIPTGITVCCNTSRFRHANARKAVDRLHGKIVKAIANHVDEAIDAVMV